MELYAPVPCCPLPEMTSIGRPGDASVRRVTAADEAVQVMTDLRHTRVVTVRGDDALDVALEKMLAAEVRLLVVAGDFGRVLGLITARDLMGEAPLSLASRRSVSRSDLVVADVMIGARSIEALPMAAVARARVGDIIATLRAARRQHALVVERGPGEHSWQLRGIFSITRIARQLGIVLHADGPVQSFAALAPVLDSPPGTALHTRSKNVEGWRLTTGRQ